MPIDMKLPELGENIEGGDVLRVMVKPGDAIKKDQPVLELETDKATIEVPSSAAGVVKEIKVKPGEKVKVGQTIFTVDEGASSGNGSSAAPAKEPAAAMPEPAKEAQPAAPKPEKRKAEVVEMKPAKQAAPPPQAPAPAPAPATDSASIPAAPSARRLARELGVNIAE